MPPAHKILSIKRYAQPSSRISMFKTHCGLWISTVRLRFCDKIAPPAFALTSVDMYGKVLSALLVETLNEPLMLNDFAVSQISSISALHFIAMLMECIPKTFFSLETISVWSV